MSFLITWAVLATVVALGRCVVGMYRQTEPPPMNTILWALLWIVFWPILIFVAIYAEKNRDKIDWMI